MSSTRLDTLIIVHVVHVGGLCDNPLYMEQLYSQQLYMVLYIPLSCATCSSNLLWFVVVARQPTPAAREL